MLKNKIRKAYDSCYQYIIDNELYDSNYITEEAVFKDVCDRTKEMLIDGIYNIPDDFDIINCNIGNENYEKMQKLIVNFVKKEL